MKKSKLGAGLLALALLAAARPALAGMNPQLAPLAPFLGKTWRGVFPDSTPEKPNVDVSRFELVLNGQAVRNLHSVNDGHYGGESIIYWDKAKETLVYYYFTTAGFYTSGTMRGENGTLVSHETVTGNANGITAVRGTSRLLPDGRLHVKTEYQKGDQWTPGRDMHYVVDEKAVVRFKE
ncbi:MAG: hypothetical protein AB7O37_08640 [Vicinamibacteria bacterium]